MRWSLLLLLVAIPTLAFAEPKVAVAPLDGDDGKIAEIVADVVGEHAKLTRPARVESAMRGLGASVLSAKTLKKLRNKLDVDVVIYGSVEKDGGDKRLSLTFAGSAKSKPTLELAFKSTKALRKDLGTKVTKRIAAAMEGNDGDDEEDEDDARARREEDEKRAEKKKREEEEERKREEEAKRKEDERRKKEEEEERRAEKKRQEEEDRRKRRDDEDERHARRGDDDERRSKDDDRKRRGDDDERSSKDKRRDDDERIAKDKRSDDRSGKKRRGDDDERSGKDKRRGDDDERSGKARRGDDDERVSKKRRGDDEDDDRAGRKKRVAEEEDDDGTRRDEPEDEDDEDGGRRHRRHREHRHVLTQAALWADAGGAVDRRTLTYDATGTMRPPPVGTAAAAGRFAAEIYPAAFSSLKGPAAGLGAALDVSHTVGLGIKVPGTAITAPIKSGNYSIGVRYRFVFGQHSLAAGVAYWKRYYIADRTKLMSPDQLDMPDVEYAAIAPGVALRIAAGPKIDAFGTVDVPLMLNSGPIQDPNNGYGAAKILAFDVRGGTQIMVASNIALQIAAELDQVGLSFTQQAGSKASTRMVTKATDRSIGLSATIGITY